jgi:hypothetical protein
MSEPETLPAPVIDRPPRNKWEREYRAFLRLLPELLKTHRGKYVAVHEEAVVDSGDDEIALTLRVYARYGYVPIHVGLVSERPPVARVPHSHAARPEQSPNTARAWTASSCPPTTGRSST